MKISREKKVLLIFIFIGSSAFLCSAKIFQKGSPAPSIPCPPCKFCYCPGPENIIVNSPVRPVTCDGDFSLIVAGTYWKAQQDGLEYAVKNSVTEGASLSDNDELNNLIDAKYVKPKFKSNGGYKLGIEYNSPCDGWDISALWTHYRECLKNRIETDESDNQALVLLWSAFQFPDANQAPILTASEIDSRWKIALNFVDLELGRECWTSKFLSFRPYVGLRGMTIEQNFDLLQQGGSFTSEDPSITLNEEVELENDFKGVGLRSGMDTIWNLGCGWALYGNLAASIIYGRFNLEHDETLRQAVSPFSKIDLVDMEESFHASRGAIDIAIGLQWRTLVCDCRYGISIGLGWEQHLFFNQNQLWRVDRKGGTTTSGILNNSGENVFQQRRGNLSTQGWTLMGKFSF